MAIRKQQKTGCLCQVKGGQYDRQLRFRGYYLKPFHHDTNRWCSRKLFNILGERTAWLTPDHGLGYDWIQPVNLWERCRWTYPLLCPQHSSLQGVKPKLPLASLIFSLCLAWTRPNTIPASVMRPLDRPPGRPSVPMMSCLLRLVLMKYVRTFPWHSLTYSTTRRMVIECNSSFSVLQCVYQITFLHRTFYPTMVT